jgi:MFS family permease
MNTLWAPLRQRTFRNLLIANVVSDVGTFMQSVGAAWLMVSLNAGPFYVALTQTASALPFFVLALPAGAMGDIVDRRRLILATETWMVTVAAILAALTFAGRMSPILLLILTFALSAGDAFESPTWRSILPELVDKQDLTAASALNGIEFNFARAVGPGIAGLLVATTGVGTAFVLNALSFVGVLIVIAKWKRPKQSRTAPPEHVMEAMGAAIRYVRYSPGIQKLLIRNGSFVFFASGFLGLLPSLARSVNESPSGYGFLLGSFGLGAVVGALTLQRVRSSWPTDVVASGAIAVVAVAIIAVSAIGQYWILLVVVLVAGAGWVLFNSVMNVLLLRQAPDWIRARVLAASQLVLQGAIAAGTALWGFVGQRAGLSTAFLIAGVCLLATTVLSLFLRLPDANVDMARWDLWRVPAVHRSIPASSFSQGRVLVTVEYEIQAEQRPGFLSALHEYGRIRRRDGAMEWGIFQDVEQPQRYVETFLVSSWDEHLRQHERLTQADRQVVELVNACLRKPPEVRHLVSAET